MRTISYYRVSTAKQGQSGLGLEAQRAAVTRYLDSVQADNLAEYVEVESGKLDTRPQLLAALHHAKVTGATLVIAKLDRLSRNVAFLATLQDSGQRFLCADMPEANELTIHIMAAMAQAERKMISQRTKDALAAAKARGQRLGNPRGAEALRRAQRGNVDALRVIGSKADAFAADLRPIVVQLREEGHTTLQALAEQLTQRGIQTARGGKWERATVRNLLARID
jgi:DNA invertase Pin-like site-specific DNA recombinase